jgi:hypothetical protein
MPCFRGHRDPARMQGSQLSCINSCPKRYAAAILTRNRAFNPYNTNPTCPTLVQSVCSTVGYSNPEPREQWQSILDPYKPNPHMQAITAYVKRKDPVRLQSSQLIRGTLVSENAIIS